MSEKTKEVPQHADATYAHTLVIKSTHEYKVHWPHGSNFPFIDSSTMQTLSIRCILNFFTSLVFSDITS